MKDRFGKRRAAEVYILREKGLVVEQREKSVSVNVPILKKGQSIKIVTLLGILRFRKSIFLPEV